MKICRCLQENSNLGIKLDNYVTGDVWLQLTSSTLAFTKSFLTLLDDCLKLKTTELLHTINETLYRVFEAQLRIMEQALRNEEQQKLFIQKNVEFLLTLLLEVTQKKYKENCGFECAHLHKLANEYSSLIIKTRSTKTKYSSDFL